MSREGNNNGSPAPNTNINSLIHATSGLRVGKPENAVEHQPPTRVPRIHIPGSLADGRRTGKSSTIKRPTFKYTQLRAVPVSHKRFPRRDLLHPKYATTRMRKLNKYRRGVVLGLKKKTRRPEQKSTRKSTRRRTVKLNK